MFPNGRQGLEIRCRWSLDVSSQLLRWTEVVSPQNWIKSHSIELQMTSYAEYQFSLCFFVTISELFQRQGKENKVEMHNVFTIFSAVFPLLLKKGQFLPSQLGRAWLHWWFFSQTIGSWSLSVYPGSHVKDTREPVEKLLPLRRPLTGMPGSRQESDSILTPEIQESGTAVKRVRMSGVITPAQHSISGSDWAHF